MEDLLYKCEHLMPLEIKCRYALQHYCSHGDHSPIIRKYVRRAKVVRPDNWRNALPESARNLDIFTVYRGGIGSIERAPLSISWSVSYDVAEWFAHRSELFYRCPCHVYQGTIHAAERVQSSIQCLQIIKKWVHDEEESNRYFNEWYTKWCEDNLESPVPQKKFSQFLLKNAGKYGLTFSKHIEGKFAFASAAQQ